MSRVEVKFDGDSRGAARAAAQTAAGIRGVGKAARDEDAHVNRLGASIRSSLGGLAVVAAKAGAAGILGLAGAVAFTGIRFDDLRQKSEIAFTTMLGSGEKAKGFLDNLAKFAAATPFEFPDLIRASQRMLAMGFAADEVVPSLTAIGDAAAALGGSSETIDTITFALGQMQSAGRVSAQDMNQLTQAGVNGWKYLAEAAGVSIAEIRKRSEKGMLDSRAAVKTILAGMERDFGGMMEKQSHTFSGLASTLKDTFTQVSGKVMAPFFEMATAGMEKLVKITSTPEFTAGVERFADALEKRARVAAAAVVEFFHDHWGDIVDFLKATWKAAGEGFDILKKIWGYADDIAEKMGGWETAAKFILAGIFAAKLLTIGERLAGIGKNLSALSRAPFAISIVMSIEALLNSESFRRRVDTLVADIQRKVKSNMGFLGDLVKTDPYPSIVRGSDWQSKLKPIVDSHGKPLPAGHPNYAHNATLSAQHPDSPGNPQAGTTLPRDWHGVWGTGSAQAEPPASDDTATTVTDTGSGGVGGSAKDAAEKARKAAAEAREAAADRQMEAWQQAIDLRNAKQAEVASILTAVGGYEAGLRADRLAAAKERAKDFADGLAKVTAANTARMADLVEKSMDAAKQALEQGRGAFAASFGRVGEAGLRAFDAATSRMQGDLARNLKTALDEIEKSRKALTAEEQAYADFRGRAQDRSLTAEEQAYADFKSGRAAAARAATRAEVMAMEDGAAKTARLRELDLDDQERALADSAATSRAARDAALADQERALAASADASRVARDVEAAAKAASVQAEYDTAKLQLDADRALQRDHFAGQLDDLATYLATRKLSVDGANKAIAKLFQEFGVDPSFKQAGIDAGDGFATGLRERLADALKSFEKLQQIAAPGVPKTAGEAMRIVFPNFHAFAGGGRVPGRYVGVADTVQARLTPGEEVIDRSLAQSLRAFLAGQGGRGSLSGARIYVLGTTDREVAAALRRIVDGAPVAPSYASARG